MVLIRWARFSCRWNGGRIREESIASRWLSRHSLSGRCKVVNTTAHVMLLGLGEGWMKVAFIRYATLPSQSERRGEIEKGSIHQICNNSFSFPKNGAKDQHISHRDIFHLLGPRIPALHTQSGLLIEEGSIQQTCNKKSLSQVYIKGSPYRSKNKPPSLS